ncbi:MAG: sulfurtransferase [Candidatus Nitrosocaldaceae archaeon]|nr:MAG: sulfurtransferase [Candidatus Nitrosocaldaceae archaeon]
MLITVEELKDRKDALIIDARDWHEYQEGHIPNAVNLDLFAFHFTDTSKEGIRLFDKMMSNLLASIGVSYDRFIVLYDNITGILSARGLWLLHYFSHYNCAVLDGGFEEWKKYYPVEKEANVPKPANFEPRINNDVLATIDEVLNTNAILIDARSEEEYKGKIVRAARGGHIPKAINIDWNLNMNGNKLKSREELAELYNNFDEAICYCQGAYRAAHTYLALRLLNKKAKVYLGSWYEYGNRLDLPVE